MPDTTRVLLYYKPILQLHDGWNVINCFFSNCYNLLCRIPVINAVTMCCNCKLFFQLTPQNVFDVLVAADIYLLPGLKFQCAALMGQFLDLDNILTILNTSRLYNIPRLEDQCAEFVANNIERVCR